LFITFNFSVHEAA